MNIQVIDEHSVDLDLLPDKATILDAGCRGFGFTNYFRERGHIVSPVDCDYIHNEYGNYHWLAISASDGWAKIIKSDDPQATRIEPGTDIVMLTIESFSKRIGHKFDLIKLDIEGEEYEILKTAQHPIAKQISVEFHAHTGRQSKESLDNLLDYLSEFYTIHNRVWEERHGCSANYWDVLLCAK